MGLSATHLSERLGGTDELALLDGGEQAVPDRGRPFSAASAPPSRLGRVIADPVPRRSAPVVGLDGGDEGLAEKAQKKLRGLHYSTAEPPEPVSPPRKYASV